MTREVMTVETLLEGSELEGAELARAVAVAAITARNAGVKPGEILTQLVEAYHIAPKDFPGLYERGCRECFDELTALSKLPITVWFTLYARNKHGNEKQVGYVQATGYDLAIKRFYTKHEPFFFDQEDMRAEVLLDLEQVYDR